MAEKIEIGSLVPENRELIHEKGIEPNSEMYQAIPSYRAQRLLYYLQGVGRFRCTMQYCVERRASDSFSIFTITEGRLKVGLDGQETTLCTGEFGFLNCNEQYRFQALEPVEYLWVHLNGANTWAFCEEVRSVRGVAIRPDNPRYIQQQLRQILDQVRRTGQVDEVGVSRSLHDLMCSLLYSNRLEETNDPQIAAMQRYLAEHLNEEVSAADLAKRFHLSISQINRRFRESTGQSPHEYLVNLRISHSKTLLRESRRSIADIAGEVGYAYDTSFAAVFRSKVGVSPRQYRNMFI